MKKALYVCLQTRHGWNSFPAKEPGYTLTKADRFMMGGEEILSVRVEFKDIPDCEKWGCQKDPNFNDQDCFDHCPSPAN